MKDILKDLSRLKLEYEKGNNIIELLHQEFGDDLTREEKILISYDLQAGSYTRIFDQNSAKKVKYCEELVEKLDKIGEVESFLLVGVGEAITLGNVVSRMKYKPKNIFGFDISWSRVDYAKRFLERFKLEETFLFTGNLFDAPFLDNSIELVMSNHSLEPNGGKEKEALNELFRISSKYIVLNEPCYDWADEESQKRIVKMGYVKNLHLVAEELGFNIKIHEKFEHPTNPKNPTSYLLIEKEKNNIKVKDGVLACPVTKLPLILQNQTYFCKGSMLSYPIIEGIPCFNKDNAVLTASREVDDHS